MRAAAVVLLLLLIARAAEAHPGIGIVMDSRGNVYYTDLANVWRIDRNGGKRIAVHGVHTHELHMDAQDNLYGEHLWYNGERTDTWGHYVWRLRPNGVLDTLIAPSGGFLQNYSFVRDRAGNMYWAQRDSGVIQRRSPDGRITVFSRGPFRDIGWMTATPDGVLYFMDDVAGRAELRRVDVKGHARTLATALASSQRLRVWAGGRHRVMGIWPGLAGDVYVASYSTGEVKRIDAAGRVSTTLRTAYPWAPTGGMVAPNGELWILEYAVNDVRVRRVSPDGRSRTY